MPKSQLSITDQTVYDIAFEDGAWKTAVDEILDHDASLEQMHWSVGGQERSAKNEPSLLLGYGVNTGDSKYRRIPEKGPCDRPKFCEQSVDLAAKCGRDARFGEVIGGALLIYTLLLDSMEK